VVVLNVELLSQGYGEARRARRVWVLSCAVSQEGMWARHTLPGRQVGPGYASGPGPTVNRLSDQC